MLPVRELEFMGERQQMGMLLAWLVKLPTISPRNQDNSLNLNEKQTI
jgi:hypothetical protein